MNLNYTDIFNFCEVNKEIQKQCKEILDERFWEDKIKKEYPESYSMIKNLDDPILSEEALKNFLNSKTWNELYQLLDFTKWYKNTYLMFHEIYYLSAIEMPKSLLFQIPESIGVLKNLEYINLSNNGISKLPKSICKLTNLQRTNDDKKRPVRKQK